MSEMTNEIINTHDLAEQEWDGHSEPHDVDTSMVATKEPEDKGIEFHVSMRDYTMRDMEALIIEAAAMQIVGKFGNDRLAKEIEAKTISLVTAKADKALEAVTSEIIDQPITPKYPFMKKDEAPVTMRQFIGLTGQAYLTARVDNSGNPTTDNYYSKSRIQHFVEKFMDVAFKREIEKATNLAIAEVRNAIEAQHKAFLEAEKTRFREALAKVAS